MLLLVEWQKVGFFIWFLNFITKCSLHLLFQQVQNILKLCIKENRINHWMMPGFLTLFVSLSCSSDQGCDDTVWGSVREAVRRRPFQCRSLWDRRRRRDATAAAAQKGKFLPCSWNHLHSSQKKSNILWEFRRNFNPFSHKLDFKEERVIRKRVLRESHKKSEGDAWNVGEDTISELFGLLLKPVGKLETEVSIFTVKHHDGSTF